MDMTQSARGSAYVVGEVRAEMARQGITQPRLAPLIGMKTSGLNSRLAGRQEFKISELIKIADALGVPVAQFMPAPVLSRQ